MHVAYMRHIGPYKGDTQLFQDLWQRLIRWSEPRGLLQQREFKIMAVYHDNPEITDDGKLRISICISVPEKIAVEGDIGRMKIDGGPYALGYFEIDATQYADAWNFMYGNWLPESGYQPDDRPPFEMYLNTPEEHPQKKHFVNICVPVKPL